MKIQSVAPDIMAPQIIENLSTALFLFDHGLKLRYMNPSAEVLFGIGARKIQGLPVREIFADSSYFIEHIEDACHSGQAFSEHELSISIYTSRTITVDVTVTPVTEDSDSMSILIELQQVDRHLRISRDENLLAQNSATRALLRGMAHEIKNPLGGLRGAAQLLQGELDKDELIEYTRIIIGEADRMQKLVDSMLGPNRIQKAELTNIHEVLERVRSLVLAEAHDVTIVRDYDPSIPEISGEKDSLIQAILNIVRNAVEANEQDCRIVLRTRIERKFTIANVRYDLVARVDITDNGPGISEEMREKIFYPMITTRAEGTGLGLTIAQTLVNRHGGLIACESEPGKTCFTILIPITMESSI